MSKLDIAFLTEMVAIGVVSFTLGIVITLVIQWIIRLVLKQSGWILPRPSNVYTTGNSNATSITSIVRQTPCCGHCGAPLGTEPEKAMAFEDKTLWGFLCPSCRQETYFAVQ
jgi:hypothetical protein